MWDRFNSDHGHDGCPAALKRQRYPITLPGIRTGRKTRTYPKYNNKVKQLQADKHLQEALLDNLPVIALIVKKYTQEIVACNQLARNLGAAVGRTCRQSLLQNRRPCSFCLAPKLWETNEPQQTEAEFFGRYWEIRWVPYTDDLYIHYLTDITERKQAEETIRQSEKRLIGAQRMAKLGDFVWDTGTNQVRWSDGLFDMLQHDRTDAIDYARIHRQMLHPEDRERIAQWLNDAVSSGKETLPPNEYRMLRRDGTQLYVRTVGMIEYGEGKKSPRVFGTVQDITERKQAEAELLQLADELKRSNADLEQFACTASHDLQEPLRTVSCFIKLLHRRYRGRLDAKADEFIAIAVDGTARMHRLLKDLLEYSRVDNGKEPYGPIELRASLDQALHNLQAAIAEAGAEVRVRQLPRVRGGEMQMAQLFQNLVSNGIKFRDGKKPVIEISSERQDNEWVIHVRDNGIGIEPQYFDQIFGIFTRLHSQDLYPGTGLGLALCKRIVERHGGRIWVDSTPGAGTTFSFSLPAV